MTTKRNAAATVAGSHQDVSVTARVADGLSPEAFNDLSICGGRYMLELIDRAQMNARH